MIFTLFLFNDPFYVVHVYMPSFMTFAFTEFVQSIFIAGILIYWLRELGGFRPRAAPADWGCIKKAVFASQGVNTCAAAFLYVFFLILVVDFMVLNCTYFIYL